jgi:hypothetical protein
MKTLTKLPAMIVTRAIALAPWAATAYVALEIVHALIG